MPKANKAKATRAATPATPTVANVAATTPAKPVYLALNPCKPYAVKAKHNALSWGQLQSAIASGLTLAQMGATSGPIGNKRFARYCLRRGWVVTAAKPAKAAK